MNNIDEIIKKNNIHPIGYHKIKSVYIVDSKNESFVIKLNTNNYDIYKYLVTKNFILFPKNYNNLNDNYDLSLYINGLNINQDEKVNEYVKVIALLHYKTSYKRGITLDEIKEKYELLNNKINYLRSYYQNINDKIDHELFLSPRSYLLVRNISLIYSILDIDSLLLNKIYNMIKDDNSIRVSLLHNNVDLDHLIISDKNYLVSWDKSYFDSPIYEIENIYRNYYHNIDLNDLLKIYESINKLTVLEKSFLIIILSIPKEIKFSNNDFLDTKNINNEINYLSKVYELLIKCQNEL